MTSTKAEPARSPLDWAKASLPLVIVLGSVTALQVFGHKPPPPTASVETNAAQLVKTTKVEPFASEFRISVEGVARPFRQIPLAAEVAGRIRFKSPKCQEATYVSAGELLLEIDPTDYELAIQRVSHELAQTENALKEWTVERNNTEAQISLAERDLKLATVDVERTKQLVARGGASAAEVEKAERAELVARNALLTANNSLRLLTARYDRAISARDLQKSLLKKAELDLQRTKILAPCDGTIVTESVEQDAYVQVGNPVVVMNDTSAGEVVCQLQMDDMVWLWAQRSRRTPAAGTGPPASVESSSGAGVAEGGAGAAEGGAGDALSDQAAAGKNAAQAYEFPRLPVTVEFPVGDLVCRWQGDLMRFAGAGVDLETRTVPCLVEVAQPRGGELIGKDGQPDSTLDPPPLIPGMFVKVHIGVKPHLPLIAIPDAGLRPGGMVWLARNGQLHEVPFQVARRLSGQVLGYLHPHGPQLGEDVIMTPLAFPREGMAVQEIDP